VHSNVHVIDPVSLLYFGCQTLHIRSSSNCMYTVFCPRLLFLLVPLTQVCEWLPVIDVHLQRPYLPSKSSRPSAVSLPSPHPDPHRSKQQLTQHSSLHQQQACLGRWGAKADGLEPGGWDMEEEEAGGRGSIPHTYDRATSNTSLPYGLHSSSLVEGDPAQQPQQQVQQKTAEDDTWVVEVDLKRLRGGRGAGGKRGKPRAYAPRFPKVRRQYLVFRLIFRKELFC